LHKLSLNVITFVDAVEVKFDFLKV